MEEIEFWNGTNCAVPSLTTYWLSGYVTCIILSRPSYHHEAWFAAWTEECFTNWRNAIHQLVHSSQSNAKIYIIFTLPYLTFALGPRPQVKWAPYWLCSFWCTHRRVQFDYQRPYWIQESGGNQSILRSLPRWSNRVYVRHKDNSGRGCLSATSNQWKKKKNKYQRQIAECMLKFIHLGPFKNLVI